VSIYFGRPFIEYLQAETSDPVGLFVIAALTIAATCATVYYFIKWSPKILDEDKDDRKSEN
jgi:hypothetical protein